MPSNGSRTCEIAGHRYARLSRDGRWQAFLASFPSPRTTRIMVALGYPEHWRIGRWSLSSFLELV